jgi:peptidoglycan biosynthesis protein MviN/MurJ (putative lipid II flippase)
LTLGVLAALQLAASFAVHLAVLRYAGAGGKTDAYIASQAVPLVMSAILAASLLNVWQPRLSVAHADATRWREVQSSACGQAFILFGIATLVLAGTVGWWQRWLFPTFGEGQRSLLGGMTLPLLLVASLNGVAMLQTASLRARERYFLAESLSLGATLLALAAVTVLLPRYGIAWVPWILALRSFVLVAALFIVAGRAAPSLRQGLRDTKAWTQLRPVVGASSLHKVSPLVDRFWSSQAPAGGLTLYGLAQMAVLAGGTVLERALSMPASSRMGRLHAAAEHRTMRRAYRATLLHVTAAVVLLALVLVLLLPVWTSLVVPVLKLNVPDARSLWLFLLLLLPTVFAGPAGSACVAVFYAMGEMKAPSRIISIGFFVALVFKSVGFLAWGLQGLAVATSVCQLLLVGGLVFALERRFRRLQIPPAPEPDRNLHP